jgi:hypothetical protein
MPLPPKLLEVVKYRIFDLKSQILWGKNIPNPAELSRIY